MDPINDYMRHAVRHVTRGDHESQDSNGGYDRSARERVFIIDVNGDVFNVVESYEPEFTYGNLFDTAFSEIAASESRARSTALSGERMQRFCGHCPYFGSCPGDFVANATRVEREILEARGCLVHAMLDHILDVFKRTDLNEFILETYKTGADFPAKTRHALSVA